jgi:hypothetical protein
MTSRLAFVVACFALTLSPCVVRPAAAQSPDARPNRFPVSFMPASFAGTPAVDKAPNGKTADAERPRPSILMTSLYATTVIVQGLDAHSTLKAINAGATERNRVMSVFTSRPPAFVALKAGAAAGLILAGRRLAKHSKLQAAIALIAIDSTYALIAAHNYRVANRLK